VKSTFTDAALTFAAALLAGSTVASAAPAPAAPAAPASAKAVAGKPADIALEPGEGRQVAERLASDLLKTFVIPENATDYAAMLRSNAAAGRYDSGSRGAVAKLMTEDLQAVHKDGHLHVEVLEPKDESGERGGGLATKFPPLIQSAKTIAPGIAYIRFSAFLGRDEEMAAVRKWLADNRAAKTVIFDLRNHHGGGLDEQDAIFSYLYARPTPLVRMTVSKAIFDQGRFPFEASPTMAVETSGDRIVATHSAIPGEATPLRDAKVYLLTSNRSASAAEHFALALKSTGRATLIGEATAGANHFGGMQELSDHFGVWMPVGRTYDIATGEDWEGDGVAPDIAVDPKLALVKALEMAGLPHDEAVRLDAGEVPAEPVHKERLAAR
jgi:hypothetical protein